MKIYDLPTTALNLVLLFILFTAVQSFAQLPVPPQPGGPNSGISGGSIGAVSDNPPIRIPLPAINKDKPVGTVKKPKPAAIVIFDARPYFEFTLSHFEKSHPIRWEDYSQTEDGFRSDLDPDLNALQRKLRVNGVSPATEIIVLGDGVKSRGEEGRIAWMLNYLGMPNVKVFNYDTFDAEALGLRSKVGNIHRNQQQEQPEVEGAYWKLKPNDKLRIKKNQLAELLKAKIKDFTLIDLRSKDDFNKDHIEGAKNLPWASFVSKDGNPVDKSLVMQILEKYKIDSKNKIIFYSQNGIESGYATFVLTQAGLAAQNFDGGYDEWQVDSGKIKK